MDLLYFIRLFKRNIVLLIGVPLLLSIVVYYFARNQEKVYQSEAIIYTGITTGYSIESTVQRSTDFFSTSAQFDNMINLLKSRQTVVETSIRLLAQDLSLDHYNPQYISKDNFEKLQQMVPQRIKDLVVKNGKNGVQRKKEAQIHALEKEIQSLEKKIRKKRNQAIRELSKLTPAKQVNTVQHASSDLGVEKNSTADTDYSNFITHTVLPGESLASIASRYGVSVGELMQLNGLTDNNISAGQTLIIKKLPASGTPQYHIVKPGENLYIIAKKYGINISKLRELNHLGNRPLTVGQKLLISGGRTTGSGYDVAVKQVSPDYTDEQTTPATTAQTTTSATPSTKSAAESYNNPAGVFVKDPIIPPGVKKSDYEKTVANLRNYYAANDTNFIYGLLHYGSNKHYSINSISRIQIYRINNSDLVKLTYTSDDPGICEQTLKIISQVFMDDYKSLRVNETDRVVKYFAREVDSADKKLQQAEDRLLRFNKTNNIINYYEQSKAIAGQKEALDKYYQDQQVRLFGAMASLRALETKMTARDSIYLKSDAIRQKEKELAEVTQDILVNRLAEGYSSTVKHKLTLLEQKQQQLRNEIKLYVDQLYLYGHSTQGVPIQRLLDSWLQNKITYVEARAALVVLAQRKLDFIKTYQKMAPLGAMLTRIQREIKVAEQTYLELLHSLNLAKMKQQNMEMSTNIKVVDPPFFPIQPNPSKTKYIVLAAGVFGFLVVALLIVLLEYFDTSVKSPSRVVEQTEMQLAGAYPLLSSRHQANELSQITTRLVDMMIQNIKLNLEKSEFKPEKPFVVLIFSTQNETGKTLIAQKIVNRMRSMGDRILFLNYKEGEATDDEDYNYTYRYEIKNNFIDVANLQELMGSRYLRKNNTPYDYIFIELPSIIYHTYPIKLLSEIDLAIYIIKSSNRFAKADKTAMDIFKEAYKGKPIVVLNEVELYNLDDLMSDLPKTRKNNLDKLKNLLKYPTKYKIVFKKEA
ncbi:LysM peptidoglycan-binding domain-containing protein [Candidatus Sulfidibacterium hydrothermale]|uniref:LysM peptidoglycan-binding domain-containing protein n=1 Tax=Candidatus Sulfidibacterium hydrothermale TaxID=2875962 RepID=UPI001F0A2601|nr:LysM peptidoglycan-binding domain-containing protein [Candidatus Sulfidibacterium hydrothermale]UBM63584.1 LysM peptidoglycan-binding domain-containing protein [Candidatus Sulfidibacterium hydrothermale]